MLFPELGTGQDGGDRPKDGQDRGSVAHPQRTDQQLYHDHQGGAERQDGNARGETRGVHQRTAGPAQGPS